MEGVDGDPSSRRSHVRPEQRPDERDGWIELFTFVFFGVTLVATIVSIVLT